MGRRNIHQDAPAGRGRLTARPGTDGDRPETPPSIRTLSAGTERAGLISVPPGYRPDRPAPLLVQLQGAGFEVLYREFDGGHAVPPDIAREAVGWLLDDTP